MSNISAITQHMTTAVDLARVKCMHVVKVAEHYNLCMELSARIDSFYNPATEEWEKEILYDVVTIRYEYFDMAMAYLGEWTQIWQDWNARAR